MTKEEIDKLVDNLPDLTCNQGRYVIVKEGGSQCFEYLLEDGTLIKSDNGKYRDWETDRKSTRLNSSHRSLSRMPSSA